MSKKDKKPFQKSDARIYNYFEPVFIHGPTYRHDFALKRFNAIHMKIRDWREATDYIVSVANITPYVCNQFKKESDIILVNSDKENFIVSQDVVNSIFNSPKLPNDVLPIAFDQRSSHGTLAWFKDPDSLSMIQPVISIDNESDEFKEISKDDIIKKSYGTFLSEYNYIFYKVSLIIGKKPTEEEFISLIRKVNYCKEKVEQFLKWDILPINWKRLGFGMAIRVARWMDIIRTEDQSEAWKIALTGDI